LFAIASKHAVWTSLWSRQISSEGSKDIKEEEERPGRDGAEDAAVFDTVTKHEVETEGGRLSSAARLDSAAERKACPATKQSFMLQLVLQSVTTVEGVRESLALDKIRSIGRYAFFKNPI
jgi:hypothetical protein